jgi:hypothetical protein
MAGMFFRAANVTFLFALTSTLPALAQPPALAMSPMHTNLYSFSARIGGRTSRNQSSEKLRVVHECPWNSWHATNRYRVYGVLFTRFNLPLCYLAGDFLCICASAYPKSSQAFVEFNAEKDLVSTYVKHASITHTHACVYRHTRQPPHQSHVYRCLSAWGELLM